jgi:hypothetical protein
MLGKNTMTPIGNTADDLHAAFPMRRGRVYLVIVVMFSFPTMESLLEMLTYLFPLLAMRMTLVERCQCQLSGVRRGELLTHNGLVR